MKSIIFTITKSFLILLLLNSCSAPVVENETTDPNNVRIKLTNKTFDFSTSRQVKIAINDVEKYAKYDVYAYSEKLLFAGNATFLNQSNEIVTEAVYRNDVLDKLIFTGVPVNGVLTQTINVPKYCTQLYIRRNNNLNFSSSIVPIINGEASTTFTKTSSTKKTSATTLVNDYLYCVNEAKELFQIDPTNGIQTLLSNMPEGSNTCAVDSANKLVYSIGNKSPHPLMKYSIAAGKWTTIKDLGIGGNRLDFNVIDGFLYYSELSTIYTINPTTGFILTARTIDGIKQDKEGDLAFDKDGTLYLCTSSEVYKLQLNLLTNKYDSTKITNGLDAFHPTSMTFDSDDNIWLANNPTTSDLVIMNKTTGKWQYKYGKVANNNTDINRKIDDLATFRASTTLPVIIDTDGDGIQDQDDAFPLDSDVAFELFTPSKSQAGTIAFEDLWPYYGDYDFNDVALNYQVVLKLNAKGLAVQMDFICNVKSNGAGFTNGIGIELGNLSPSQIKSVTGTVLTENYITLNSNGTEANQTHAVIILTDAAKNLLSKRTISIKFTTPITTPALGIAPFNPFIIANKERKNEIHLPYSKPTSLGDNKSKITGTSRDINGNYLSAEGMPWAISFIDDFKVPKEKMRVYEAYNYFIEWVNSNGLSKNDWYKDKPGHMDSDKIQN
jgi:LruC domain-containing protein